jgi:hypothetical protein
MLKILEKFFIGVLNGLQHFASFGENLLNRFLNGCLEFVDATSIWLKNTIDAIILYLSELLPLLGAVLKSFFLLSLFYIPSILMVPIGFWKQNTWVWVLGVVWAIAITAIGLGFRKNQKN